MNDIDTVKKRLGEESAALVKPHTLIGIGTGTTVFWFIESLAKRCKEGLSIKAVATSRKSHLLAESKQIPLIDSNLVTTLDLTVDGADALTESKEMIKGGGGALLREKIVASMSKQVCIIVDETKMVSSLKKHKLPVELLPFGSLAAIKKIEALGFYGNLRKDESENLYITDNGNYIFDIEKSPPSLSLQETEQLMYQIPGVLETGFFHNLPTQVLVGYQNGVVKTL